MVLGERNEQTKREARGTKRGTKEVGGEGTGNKTGNQGVNNGVYQSGEQRALNTGLPRHGIRVYQAVLIDLLQ